MKLGLVLRHRRVLWSALVCLSVAGVVAAWGVKSADDSWSALGAVGSFGQFLAVGLALLIAWWELRDRRGREHAERAMALFEFLEGPVRSAVNEAETVLWEAIAVMADGLEKSPVDLAELEHTWDEVNERLAHLAGSLFAVPRMALRVDGDMAADAVELNREMVALMVAAEVDWDSLELLMDEHGGNTEAVAASLLAAISDAIDLTREVASDLRLRCDAIVLRSAGVSETSRGPFGHP